jgi:uncharacterized SAM-binding protein YcdF (DUF218 family)
MILKVLKSRVSSPQPQNKTVTHPTPSDSLQPKALWLRAVTGFIVGALSWLATTHLGIAGLPGLRLLEASDFSMLFVAAFTAWLMTTRAQKVVWSMSGALCLLLIIVGSTPLSLSAVRGLVHKNQPMPADAIYVLGAGILSNGELPHPFQTRAFHAYELLGQGYAANLIVPRLRDPDPPYKPAVQRQLNALQIKVPLWETPVVANTHDEAVVVSDMMRQRGWKRLIVVTNPAHTRRAVAVFEKAGVQVISSPCTEGNYDLSGPNGASGRFAAFRDWLHEAIGYRVYRQRGWI